MKKDTTRLLRECAAGAKMGERSLNLAVAKMKSGELKNTLESASETHAIIGDEARKMLYSARQNEKQPNPISTLMSEGKIKAACAISPKPETIASLMTDGCNMGAKSLTKALAKYPAASPQARFLCQRLITAEDNLRDRLRKYL